MIEITHKLMTGVALVDNQHKEITSRINKLLNLCTRYDANAFNEAKEILDFLAYYVGNHFADEERLQLECGYSDYSKHRQEHTNFTMNFLKIKDDFEKAGCINDSILRSINIAVVDWLINHIGISDVSFAKFYLYYQSLKPRGPQIVGKNNQG